jgi:uncharacterized damage-inducible protein DinB
MSEVDDHGRRMPPSAGTEAETLVGFLEYQRGTFAWKCQGLDAQGLGTSVGPSSMTLGGMLKHLANVEDWWFSHWLCGQEQAEPWREIDWENDPDWDWHSGALEPPEALFALWQNTVERSRQQVAEALAEGGPGQPARRRDATEQSLSLRWILCHMIEEYARHNGHADLLRESVDGQTGE